MLRRLVQYPRFLPFARSAPFAGAVTPLARRRHRRRCCARSPGWPCHRRHGEPTPPSTRTKKNAQNIRFPWTFESVSDLQGSELWTAKSLLDLRGSRPGASESLFGVRCRRLCRSESLSDVQGSEHWTTKSLSDVPSSVPRAPKRLSDVQGRRPWRTKSLLEVQSSLPWTSKSLSKGQRKRPTPVGGVKWDR